MSLLPRFTRSIKTLPEQIQRRPALMLFTFNVSAQFIGVLASPLLTRLYSPEQFGVLGAITAIVMVCVPLSTGRYEVAIPRARSDAEAMVLFRVCLVSVMIGTSVIGALSLGATHVGPGQISELLVERWYFVPIGVLVAGLYETLAMEAIRQNNLRPLAYSKLSQSFAGVGGQLALGWFGFTSFGLLVGFILNQSMGVGRLFRELILKQADRGAATWTAVKAAACEHRRYPLYASWTSSLEVCGKWSLQFAVAILWDPKIAGFMLLTDRLAGRPLQLLSSSLLPVYIANVSKALREAPNTALKFFYTSLGRQAALAGAWTACVVLLSPWVVPPLFGSGWAESVPYIQVMTLAIAPLACFHAVGHTLQITGNQKLDAAMATFKVLVIALVVGITHWRGASALMMMSIFAATQICFAIATFFFYRGVLVRAVAEALAAEKKS